MKTILAAFHLDDPASLKRFLLLALTAIIGLVSPWLASKGVPVPSDGVLEGLAAIVAVFLLQSGIKSAAQIHGEAVAAAKVEVATPEQAAVVISDAAKGPTP